MRIDDTIDELVVANRILASQRVVDTLGHVSVRSPENPQRFFLSCARAPDSIEASDIMEFTLDGNPIGAHGRKPYLERFIHAALYEARPDINSVVHNHSHSVIPFGVTGKKLRPIMHVGAVLGADVPIWDSADRFDDILVINIEMGRSLAECLGAGTVALMRGHGATVVGRTLRQAVHTSIQLQVNAELQQRAVQLAGEKGIKFLSQQEIDVMNARDPEIGIGRAWESWRRQAGI